ncbi:DUF6976 family protein [Spirochaeta dissipatitropha]
MLKTTQELEKDISAGKCLFIAGEERLLKQLPKGNWIAGTIPYFMDESGGTVSQDRVFVTEAPGAVINTRIKMYEEKALPQIPADAPENGFSLVIIPATSPAHTAYAQNAPDYAGLFMKSIIGWIAGVHLDDLGSITPKVFDGSTGQVSDQAAVVMHCEIQAGRTPEIGIINLFRQGNGDTITFSETGFSAGDCFVNGVQENLAAYLRRINADTRLPLVANYSGAMVNVSFQAVKDNTVDFYAPVFSGVEYRIASPIQDYVTEFTKALPSDVETAFSCNCILNFLYSELEGKQTPGMSGPITFGEIAYQLLNQTLVYLQIK